MEMRLKMLQFKVAGLEDIRTLCNRWQAGLDRLGEEQGSEEAEAYRRVGVEVEWRRPRQEVFINLLAPPALLERFMNELKAQGLAFSQEEVIPWMVVRCRLLPRPLQ
jgi:hypothetical protein